MWTLELSTVEQDWVEMYSMPPGVEPWVQEWELRAFLGMFAMDHDCIVGRGVLTDASGVARYRYTLDDRGDA